MTHNPTPHLPPPLAPDDPALAAWVIASTDGLPDGETLPAVDPITQAAMTEAVEAFAAAMAVGEADHGPFQSTVC